MAHFDTDPSLLPTTSHWGIEIPEILFVLFRLLELCDGFKAEGIFRVAGKHAEMSHLISNFDAGLPIYSNNPHCIATLIKVFKNHLKKPKNVSKFHNFFYFFITFIYFTSC